MTYYIPNKILVEKQVVQDLYLITLMKMLFLYFRRSNE